MRRVRAAPVGRRAVGRSAVGRRAEGGRLRKVAGGSSLPVSLSCLSVRVSAAWLNREARLR